MARKSCLIGLKNLNLKQKFMQLRSERRFFRAVAKSSYLSPMLLMSRLKLSGFVLSSLAATVLIAMPVYAKAQKAINRIMEHTNTTELVFSPYTVGSVIRRSTNHVYKFRVKKGDDINITINSLGTRSGVTLFDSDSLMPIKAFYPSSQYPPDNEFSHKVPKEGYYYLHGYAGPHFYNLTIWIDESLPLN